MNYTERNKLLLAIRMLCESEPGDRKDANDRINTLLDEIESNHRAQLLRANRPVGEKCPDPAMEKRIAARLQDDAREHRLQAGAVVKRVTHAPRVCLYRYATAAYIAAQHSPGAVVDSIDWNGTDDVSFYNGD